MFVSLIMDKTRIAFFTGTPEACKAVLDRLQQSGENIYPSTVNWLKKGLCLYRYVICDPVDFSWNGYEFLEQKDYREVDDQKEWFTRKFEEIEL